MQTWKRTAEGNYESGDGVFEIRRGFSKLENATTWTLVHKASGQRVLTHDSFTLRAAKQDARDVMNTTIGRMGRRPGVPVTPATVARLPCGEFSRFLRAVLGRPVETGTAIAKRVRHPSAFEIEHEAPCRAFVRYASDLARLELTRVLQSYQRAMPLRVTALRFEGRRGLLVEVQ
jgi:hypothetical protein